MPATTPSRSGPRRSDHEKRCRQPEGLNASGRVGKLCCAHLPGTCTAWDRSGRRQRHDDRAAQEAAHRLGLSHSTVKHHLANARSKVGAETTAQLVWILAPRLPEPEGVALMDE